MHIKIIAQSKPDDSDDGVVESVMNIGYSETETDLPIVKNSKLTESLISKMSQKIGLLPPAVRWISDSGRIVVFERPPTIQTLSYSCASQSRVLGDPACLDIYDENGECECDSCIEHDDRDYQTHSFNIPVPWTVYLVYFDLEFNPIQIRVYFRPKPIEDMSDKLFLIPLPNFYMNSKLCDQTFSYYSDSEDSMTLAKGIETVYNRVWNSGFNYDLVDAVNSSIHQEVFKKNPILTVTEIPPHAQYSWDVQTKFFFQWSNYSLEEILSVQWPNPLDTGYHPIQTQANPGPNSTITSAIESLNSSVNHDTDSELLSRKFIVNIANAINSL